MDGDREFDRPLFKKLAHNDTGAAAGHQAGVLIPLPLAPYFPDLAGRMATAVSPTVDEAIRAILFVGDTYAGVVSTRYQYQTWGGTRSPERRITGNLTGLLGTAKSGDFLVIERGINDPKLYRLRLLKAGTPEHGKLATVTAGRQWGPVNPADRPVPENAVAEALIEQAAHEAAPLALFDNAAVFTETRSKRIARSRAFQQLVSALYNFRCAVCGNGFHSPTGDFSEIEAAHIVPRSVKGADDARNGMALCRSHHWAFDRGLFGVNRGGLIMIPAKVSALPQNANLTPFASQPLHPPVVAAFQPSPQAFAWHLTNIAGQHF